MQSQVSFRKRHYEQSYHCLSLWPWNYLETLPFLCPAPIPGVVSAKIAAFEIWSQGCIQGHISLYAGALFVLPALSVSILGQRDWMWGSVLHAWLQTFKSIPSHQLVSYPCSLTDKIQRKQMQKLLCVYCLSYYKGRAVHLKFYENLLVLRPCSLLENFLPYGRKPWSCRVL